jgi:hypothetical protein
MDLSKNVISTDDLLRMATEFEPTIKMEIVTDDPEQLVSRSTHIASIMATTGKMLADAKYWRDKALKESILKRLKGTGLPASTLNDLVKADCHDLNYLVNWIEQQDKDCKYQIELLRTLISLRKQEMATFNQ